MIDKKVDLLPFAPYSTRLIEEWINEESQQGWQVTGTIPYIPILVKFIRG